MAKPVMLYDDSLHERIVQLSIDASKEKGKRVTIQETIAAAILLLEKEFPDIAKKEESSAS